MRILSVLLLCVSVWVLGVLRVSGQYVTDGASSFAAGWLLAGAGISNISNPTLNLTAGNTYTFDVSASSPNHPFNFSTSTSDMSAAVTILNGTYYIVSASAGCNGTANSGWYALGTSASPPGTCVVSLAISANAPADKIYYKCTAHYPMTGTINVLAAGTATTAAPTTAAPTTPGPPQTGGTITSNEFHITGNQATSAYVFTYNGVQYANPTLKITAGSPVTFSFEWANSKFHPFGFSTKSNTDNVALSQDYFPDALNGWSNNSACDITASTIVRTVTINPNITNPTTNPCVITVQTQSIAGNTIYYRCARHPNMIGTINLVGSSASTVAVSGLAFLVAIIATIMD